MCPSIQTLQPQAWARLSSCGFPSDTPSPQPCLVTSYSSCKGDLMYLFGSNPGPSPLPPPLVHPSCAPQQLKAAPRVSPSLPHPLTASSSGPSDTLSAVTGFISAVPETHGKLGTEAPGAAVHGSSSMNRIRKLSRGIPAVRWRLLDL